MSTFQTGQWVRRGRNIVILLNSQHPSHAVEAKSWAHEDESESGLHDTAWVQRSLNQVMGSGLVSMASPDPGRALPSWLSRGAKG